MPTILIVGASRGIGLELARTYAAENYEVHATTRTPEDPGELGALPGQVRIHALDVRDNAQLEALAEELGGLELDILIHNAGVHGRPREEMMAINAEAPIRVCDRLLDRLAEGGRLVLMTSQLGARRGKSGSLGDYGDSKAALNDAFRERIEYWATRKVNAAVVHPGWVRTDMGGDNAAISVEESVAGIRSFVDGMGDADHGRFVTWEGLDHPW